MSATPGCSSHGTFVDPGKPTYSRTASPLEPVQRRMICSKGQIIYVTHFRKQGPSRRRCAGRWRSLRVSSESLPILPGSPSPSRCPVTTLTGTAGHGRRGHSQCLSFLLQLQVAQPGGCAGAESAQVCRPVAISPSLLRVVAYSHWQSESESLPGDNSHWHCRSRSPRPQPVS